MKYLRSKRDAYDFFLFFSYRYYHAFHGIRAVGSRALLVPTAERDEVIGLSVFGPVFRGCARPHVQQPGGTRDDCRGHEQRRGARRGGGYRV